MSRTYEYYRDDLKRQEQEREELEKYDFEQQYEEEKWYHEQMDLCEEDESISEIPLTDEDIFRWILDNEKNENT